MTDTIDDVIRAVRRLDAEATAAPWYQGHNPESAEPMAYIAEAYSYGPPGRVHLTCVPFDGRPLDDTALFTAITGNGPTSEANAALIAQYRTAAPLLASEVERLRAEADRPHGQREREVDQYLSETREGKASWTPPQIIRELRAEVAELREALADAATSLDTAARWAFNDDGPQTRDELRPWASSRAREARALLAKGGRDGE